MASAVCIEFTDVDCKLLLTEKAKGGRVAVRNMAQFPLAHVDDQAARITQRAQALKDALKAAKITATMARAVIPKNFVMARTVTLPSANETEIVSMARFEAERKIPFNADRHIVSHHILAKQGVQGSDVLLAAVDQPIANEYVEICIKAGLKIESIGVSSLSAYNAFASAEPTAMTDRVVAVVNIGRAATDLVVANNGLVNFTRGSTLGLNKLLAEIEEAGPEKPFALDMLSEVDALEPHLYFKPQMAPPPAPPRYDELDADASSLPAASVPSALSSGIQGGGYSAESETFVQFARALEIESPDPEPAPVAVPEDKCATAFRNWLLRLLQEVRRTYEFAHREFDTPMIAHVYLCGEGASIRNLSQYFRVNFGIEASVFDPFRNAEVSPKIPRELLEQSVAFAAPFGAAAADTAANGVKINLLPSAYLEGIAAKSQTRSYMITGALVLVTLGAGYGFMSQKFAQHQTVLEELDDSNEKDKKRVAELESKEQRLNIIRENVQGDLGALVVLEKLSQISIVPEKATLTRVEYRKGDSVKVAGHAKDVPAANQMAAEVRRMATADGKLFFEDARLDDGALQKRRVRPGTDEIYEYSLTGTFPKKKKAKKSSTSEDEEGKTGKEESTE